MECIKILNINPKLTRPGLVQRFVQFFMEQKYDLTPTLRRPPVDTKNECDLGNLDADNEVDVTALQTSLELGAHFYIQGVHKILCSFGRF